MAFAASHRLQYIPARGRKQKCNHNERAGNQLQLIPVRGRKPAGKIAIGDFLDNCNLSPQGDGNGKPPVFQIGVDNITIYPRKGAKTYLPPSLAYGSYSTIPVRGRKLVRPAVNRCNVGTIPVRGRKLTTHGANAQTATLQFIPARGRKLHVQVKHAHLFHNCNLSPQGDKKAPLPLAFASSGGALLFLIFYFTGWELRLPGSSL